MSEIKDGGQAFPRNYAYQNPEAGMSELKSVPGLTKREWFAGMALSGNIRNNEKSFKEYAKDAFKMADAMIQEAEGSK